MSRPLIQIINVETGEDIVREMNDEEFAQYKKDQAAEKAKSDAQNEAEIAKTALLEKLGITEDEAKLLLS